MSRRRSSLRVALAVLVAVPVCAAARVANANPPRADVEKLLAAYELASTPADFQRLGPGVEAVLIEIASDARTSGIRRLRALAALAFVPGEAGRAHCRGVIRQKGGAVDGGEVLEVGACAHMLGAFGPGAASDLVPLLSHPAADVRLGAARGLSVARAAAARGALAARLSIEPDEDVRLHLERALRLAPAAAPVRTSATAPAPAKRAP